MLTRDDRITALDADANLRERVARQLRLDVLAGTAEPGTVFSVPGLARALGVSTTPVREALLQLSADGLLQPLRNRGFRVVDPTLDELRDLFEVRVQLESAALAKVVRAGPAAADDLAALADAIARAVEGRDTPAYLAADRAFHEALLARAGNPVLTGIVMKLRDRMRLYGIRSAAGLARQRASIAEHHRIVDLVSGRAREDAPGDAREDATALMTGHIMAWEPIFTEAVRARRGG